MAAAALLAACGGGSTLSGSTSTTTTGSSAVAKVTVSASPTTIAVDGSTSTTITATALNASNAAVSGQTVSFGTSTGGVIGAVSGTTNSSGVATATLTNSSAAAGSNLTVTAKVGTVSGTVTVGVVAIQQTITLTTSLPQLPSDGSKSAVITAYVKNASNQFVVGVPVNFSADSGGLAITQGTTGTNGAATATLETGSGNPANRTITVTATAGSSTATLQVQVVGTTLTVVGTPNLVINGSGTYTVSLLNSSGVGIPNQTVTLKSSNGNTLSTTSFTTDTTGQKTVTLTAVNSGADALQASVSALNLTAAQAITVSGQSFVFTTPPTQGAKVDIGTPQTLTVTWFNNSTPQANQTVSFASTRGTLSATSATTNAQGEATVTITSTDAGSATVTATATNVTTQASLDFVATNPASIALSASPATIATRGQSTITAVVRDAQDNLVEGQTVNFNTVDDTTGGTLSSASGVTDNQGRAQTVYTASSTPSATNGVVIQAAIPGNASVTQTTDLTVGGLSVGLSLGTGQKISEILNANGLPVQFSVPYTVIAADSAGNPVANVPVTVTVHALNYYKGGYVIYNAQWTQTQSPETRVPPTTPGGATTYIPSAITQCPNEDDTEPAINNAPNPDDFNGVLDPGEDGCDSSGKPWNNGVLGANQACNAYGNGNGKLDPGVTAVASPASGNTDSTGTFNFAVIYPESDALWVDVELIASTSVSGTESSASVTFRLPILASYLTTTTSSPPGNPSPYGTNIQCNVAN